MRDAGPMALHATCDTGRPDAPPVRAAAERYTGGTSCAPSETEETEGTKGTEGTEGTEGFELGTACSASSRDDHWTDVTTEPGSDRAAAHVLEWWSGGCCKN